MNDAQTHNPTDAARLRVLMLPDSIYWVTNTIAEMIDRYNAHIDGTICSPEVLMPVMGESRQFPCPVDVVHYLTPHMPERLLSAFENRVPTVLTIHHVEDDASFSAEPRCDAIMTVCRQWHDRLIELGVDEAKLVRVPNGVDENLFRPPTVSERARMRATLGLADDAVVCGFFGKKSSDSLGRKGLSTFMDAMKRVQERNPKVHSLIVGAGWEEFAASQREAGLRCTHLPFVLNREDLAQLYWALDIYWVTARIEGGPVPLLEAMSSGVCCAATPVGIVTEIVRDGVNGVICEAGDVDAFVDRTLAYAADAAYRERVSQSARESILDGWKWSDTAPAAQQLYQTAIDRFAQRTGIRPFPTPRYQTMPFGMRRWMEAFEHIQFMQVLMSFGETEPARRVAWRAVRARPWDDEVLLKASDALPASGLFRMLAGGLSCAGSLKRSLMRCAGRGNSNGPAVGSSHS